MTDRIEQEIHHLKELYYRAYKENRYEESIDIASKLKEIVQEHMGENNTDYATILNDLGFLYYTAGDYSKAEPLLQRSLEIQRSVLGENHPNYANTLNDLGLLYYTAGDYSKAEPLLQRSLEIRREILGEYHPEYANSLSNLAMLYAAEGKYDKAEPLYQKAVEILRRTVGENHPHYADILNNIAELYRAVGSYSKAEPLYQKAIEILRRTVGENHPEYANSLINLAMLYVAIHRVAEALNVMEHVNLIHERMISQIFSIGSENTRLRYLETILRFSSIFLSLILYHHSQYQSAIGAAFNLVLKRKALSEEGMAIESGTSLSIKYPEIKPKLQELNTLRMQISRMILSEPSAEIEGFLAHQQRLNELANKKELLEEYLAHSIPEIRFEQKLQTADRHAIAKALPKDSVLIDFVRTDVFDFYAIPARGDLLWKPAHYLSFMVFSGDPDHILMIDLGEVQSFDETILSIRKSIVSRKQDSTYARSSKRLREMLEPIFRIVGDSRQLLISPDGELKEGLIGASKGHYPIREIKVRKEQVKLSSETLCRYMLTVLSINNHK